MVNDQKKIKLYKERKRLLVIIVVFALCAILLLARIFYIQFIKGEEYQKLAYQQQTRNQKLTPARGAIYDRYGNDLAISIYVNTISISPTAMRANELSVDLLARGLDKILKIGKETIIEKINKESEYELLVRQVEKEIGDELQSWLSDNNIAGVTIEDDTKRYYPNDNLAAHIIGFTGIDNQGLIGIEYTMDEVLKGIPGKITSEIDKNGTLIPFSTDNQIAAYDGLDVVLTIDENIQYIVEKALDEAIFKNDVTRGATAIVMDPKTGEILAMVSKPDFDLNNPRECPDGFDSTSWTGYSTKDINLLNQTVWRNKALSDTYEPGSTFKAITASIALEENVILLSTMTDDYEIEVQGWDINCWRSYPHGEETFLEGIYNSCNPVFVKVSQLLGIDIFYEYVEMFGFYDKTKINLQGESNSLFQKDFGLEYQEIDLAVASFGQRFKITPIQIITAYSAIANDGKLLQPFIVKELLDSQGNIAKKFETITVRQVISSQTSQTMREVLKGVVSEGTGKNAYVPGYDVAGKTGTSETDEENVYTASFCGFAPAGNPVITVLVVLHDPQGDSYYGGVIAAPVVGQIIEETLEYLQVPRNLDEALIERDVLIPELIGYSIDQATDILDELQLQSILIGDNILEDVSVSYQYPLAKTIVKEESIVVLYSYLPEEKERVTMPNLLHKTIYEAKVTLNALGLNIDTKGLGTCIDQSVNKGEKIEKGSIITVTFRYTDNVE
ncbi:MAG: PASTA domain-containing protein [Clostridiales bacterium]|nr:PASTA domain-containing protein [Clostridiales bacterium]